MVATVSWLTKANVQHRATKLIFKLPFRCHVTCKSRLQLTNLLPISYWHEFLDMVFFYKVVDSLVFVGREALKYRVLPGHRAAMLECLVSC